MERQDMEKQIQREIEIEIATFVSLSLSLSSLAFFFFTHTLTPAVLHLTPAHHHPSHCPSACLSIYLNRRPSFHPPSSLHRWLSEPTSQGGESKKRSDSMAGARSQTTLSHRPTPLSSYKTTHNTLRLRSQKNLVHSSIRNPLLHPSSTDSTHIRTHTRKRRHHLQLNFNRQHPCLTLFLFPNSNPCHLIVLPSLPFFFSSPPLSCPSGLFFGPSSSMIYFTPSVRCIHSAIILLQCSAAYRGT
jgi:hypothetical protein